jgi:hypothetical protein
MELLVFTFAWLSYADVSQDFEKGDRGRLADI